jgi:hypothetical protein
MTLTERRRRRIRNRAEGMARPLCDKRISTSAGRSLPQLQGEKGPLSVKYPGGLKTNAGQTYYFL